MQNFIVLFLHFVACRWLWPFWQISQKVSFPGKNMHRSQFIISRQQPKTFERWMWSTWIYGAFRSWKAGWGLFKLVFVQWLYYNPIDASSNFLSLRSWELSNFDISPFPAPVKLSSIKNWRIFDSMTISRIFGQHRQKSAPPTQCQWVIETKIFTNMGPPEAQDKTLTQQIRI